MGRGVSDDRIDRGDKQCRTLQRIEHLGAIGVTGRYRALAPVNNLVKLRLQAGGAEMAVTAGSLMIHAVVVGAGGLGVWRMDADGHRNGRDQGQHPGGSPPPLGYAQSQSHLHPSI